MVFDDWKGIMAWFLFVTGFFVVAGIVGSLFFKISLLKILLGYIFTLVAVVVILIYMAWNDRRS